MGGMPLKSCPRLAPLTLLVFLVLSHVLWSASAQSFIGLGTTFSPTVSQWGGALNNFNCQFNYTSAWFAANFAAMNGPQWENSAACGKCVSVKCIDSCPVKNVARVLQIVDQCTGCAYGGLGMSHDAFRAITGLEPGRQATISWEWAECSPYFDNGRPNILLTPKREGSEWWQALNFANLAKPLSAVSINGQSLPRLSWNHFEWTPQAGQKLNLSGVSVLALTASTGQTITTTITQVSQQWLNVQFASTSLPPTSTLPSPSPAQAWRSPPPPPRAKVSRPPPPQSRRSPLPPPPIRTAPPSPARNPPSPPAVPPVTTTSEYRTVLGLSWIFYEAQRSGDLPSDMRVQWRRDAHLSDSVPGGWYDAGDYLKLNFPLATSATFLAWGVLDFTAAYSATNQLEYARSGLRWVADYLMACHRSKNEYVGQIGSPGYDHNFWGRPEDSRVQRPTYVWDNSKHASDLLGAAASALASASLVFRTTDQAYADKCLVHARQLYTMASKKEGKYSDFYTEATYVYTSHSFLDDLAFAAAWLYRATRETPYLDASQGYLKRAQYERSYYVSWDATYVATDNLLLSMGVRGSEPVNGDIDYHFSQFLTHWQTGSGSGIEYSRRGLAVAPLGNWGNLRYSANAAFMMLIHASYTKDAKIKKNCIEWAQGQIDYMLGLPNSKTRGDRSYVVGYGKNPPVNVHHRAASCPKAPAGCNQSTNCDSAKRNAQVLYGALVGGPTKDEVYVDRCSDFRSNEVAVDYNAGFTGALAGLIQLK